MSDLERVVRKAIREALEESRKPDLVMAVTKAVDQYLAKGFAPGTRRRRQDGMYVKQSDGSWTKVPDDDQPADVEEPGEVGEPDDWDDEHEDEPAGEIEWSAFDRLTNHEAAQNSRVNHRDEWANAYHTARSEAQAMDDGELIDELEDKSMELEDAIYSVGESYETAILAGLVYGLAEQAKQRRM